MPVSREKYAYSEGQYEEMHSLVQQAGKLEGLNIDYLAGSSRAADELEELALRLGKNIATVIPDFHIAEHMDDFASFIGKSKDERNGEDSPKIRGIEAPKQVREIVSIMRTDERMCLDCLAFTNALLNQGPSIIEKLKKNASPATLAEFFLGIETALTTVAFHEDPNNLWQKQYDIHTTTAKYQWEYILAQLQSRRSGGGKLVTFEEILGEIESQRTLAPEVIGMLKQHRQRLKALGYYDILDRPKAEESKPIKKPRAEEVRAWSKTIKDLEASGEWERLTEEERVNLLEAQEMQFLAYMASMDEAAQTGMPYGSEYSRDLLRDSGKVSFNPYSPYQQLEQTIQNIEELREMFDFDLRYDKWRMREHTHKVVTSLYAHPGYPKKLFLGQIMGLVIPGLGIDVAQNTFDLIPSVEGVKAIAAAMNAAIGGDREDLDSIAAKTHEALQGHNLETVMLSYRLPIELKSRNDERLGEMRHGVIESVNWVLANFGQVEFDSRGRYILRIQMGDAPDTIEELLLSQIKERCGQIGLDEILANRNYQADNTPDTIDGFTLDQIKERCGQAALDEIVGNRTFHGREVMPICTLNGERFDPRKGEIPIPGEIAWTMNSSDANDDTAAYIGLIDHIIYQSGVKPSEVAYVEWGDGENIPFNYENPHVRNKLKDKLRMPFEIQTTADGEILIPSRQDFDYGKEGGYEYLKSLDYITKLIGIPIKDIEAIEAGKVDNLPSLEIFSRLTGRSIENIKTMPEIDRNNLFQQLPQKLRLVLKQRQESLLRLSGFTREQLNKYDFLIDFDQSSVRAKSKEQKQEQEQHIQQRNDHLVLHLLEESEEKYRDRVWHNYFTQEELEALSPGERYRLVSQSEDAIKKLTPKEIVNLLGVVEDIKDKDDDKAFGEVLKELEKLFTTDEEAAYQKTIDDPDDYYSKTSSRRQFDNRLDFLRRRRISQNIAAMSTEELISNSEGVIKELTSADIEKVRQDRNTVELLREQIGTYMMYQSLLVRFGDFFSTAKALLTITGEDTYFDPALQGSIVSEQKVKTDHLAMYCFMKGVAQGESRWLPVGYHGAFTGYKEGLNAYMAGLQHKTFSLIHTDPNRQLESVNVPNVGFITEKGQKVTDHKHLAILKAVLFASRDQRRKIHDNLARANMAQRTAEGINLIEEIEKAGITPERKQRLEQLLDNDKEINPQKLKEIKAELKKDLNLLIADTRDVEILRAEDPDMTNGLNVMRSRLDMLAWILTMPNESLSVPNSDRKTMDMVEMIRDDDFKDLLSSLGYQCTAEDCLPEEHMGWLGALRYASSHSLESVFIGQQENFWKYIYYTGCAGSAYKKLMALAARDIIQSLPADWEERVGVNLKGKGIGSFDDATEMLIAEGVSRAARALMGYSPETIRTYMTAGYEAMVAVGDNMKFKAQILGRNELRDLVTYSYEMIMGLARASFITLKYKFGNGEPGSKPDLLWLKTEAEKKTQVAMGNHVTYVDGGKAYAATGDRLPHLAAQDDLERLFALVYKPESLALQKINFLELFGMEKSGLEAFAKLVAHGLRDAGLFTNTDLKQLTQMIEGEITRNALNITSEHPDIIIEKPFIPTRRPGIANKQEPSTKIDSDKTNK